MNPIYNALETLGAAVEHSDQGTLVKSVLLSGMTFTVSVTRTTRGCIVASLCAPGFPVLYFEYVDLTWSLANE